LAGLTSPNAKGQAALALLRAWDFRETAESGAAALFEIWQSRHLRPAFRKTVLTGAIAGEMESTDMRVMLDYLEKPSSRFGEKAESMRTALLLETLSAAYGDMEARQGHDPSQWQWGRLHHSLVEHALSELVDADTRARIDVGPFAKSGGEYTPNQSPYRATDFRQTNGPSFRIVVDVGSWDNSRAVNYPGQSGDPDGRHYRDLAPMWRKGEYFPLLYTRAAIERETELKLRLMPK
jgi:penicillin amidase